MVSAASVLSSRLRLCYNNARQSRVYSQTTLPSHAFEVDLSERFQELLEARSDPFLSLGWLSSAVDMVLSTQASLQVFVPCFQASTMSTQDRRLIEQYMDDSMRLLDVCNELRDEIGQHAGSVRVVHVALTYLHCRGRSSANRSSMLRARNALSSSPHVRASLGEDAVITSLHVRPQYSQLAAWSSVLRRMGDKLMAPHDPVQYEAAEMSACPCVLPAVIYGGQAATIFLFKLLVSTLSSANPRQSPWGPMPGRPLWKAPLLALQGKLHKELLQQRHKKKATTFLPELDSMDASVRKLHELLGRALQRPEALPLEMENDLNCVVDTTSKAVDELQTRLATLQQQIDGLFRVLIDTRMAMLDSGPSQGRVGTHESL